MPLLKSAALLAAIGLGLINVAAPGLAIELDRTPIVTAPASLPNPMPAATSTPAAVEQATVVTDTGAPITDAQDDQADYPSLTAAVAAQAAPDDMNDDLRCLAGAVYFESKGEPLSGQLAVADVIINRTRSGRFPKSICSVVTQRGQFSFVRGGEIPSIADGKLYRTAVAVAQVALADAWDSPAGDALFFHARYVKAGWGKAQVASIGNHIFYR